MRLLPNTSIQSKRMESQNPDCLDINRGTERNKTLMIYYSFSIYTTDINRTGRVLMIVIVGISFSAVINADKLFIDKIQCSIS